MVNFKKIAYKSIICIIVVLMLLFNLSACSCKHDWVDADCTSPKMCVKCGETEGTFKAHKWLDATCEKSMRCGVCGISEGEALGHTYENGKCVKCGESNDDLVTYFSSKDKEGSEITASDRARNFLTIYNELVEEYGVAKLDDNIIKGVAIVRLLDFTGSGNLCLYVAYADGSKPYVNKQMVCAFDNGIAYLLEKDNSSVGVDITSKESADDKTPSVWLYKDNNNKGYIVTGNEMSKAPTYNTYFGSDIFAFQVDSNVSSDGTYEKFDLTDVSEDDFDELVEKNEKIIESLKSVIK